MDETNKLIQEFTAFMTADPVDALGRYLSIKPIFELRFNLPEVDFVREEACRTFVAGAYIGCIVITNHLLERYCKLLLISHESGIHQITEIDTLEQRFKPYIEKYMSSDLSATLSACKSKGLIEKAKWKEFESFRETFRNGFSHGDARKIFKGATGKFVMGSFESGEVSPVTSIKVENVPWLQGIAIKQFAEGNALNYLKKVENLIRSTIIHFGTSYSDSDYQQLD